MCAHSIGPGTHAGLQQNGQEQLAKREPILNYRNPCMDQRRRRRLQLNNAIAMIAELMQKTATRNDSRSRT